jgi:hypothetical protein
VSPSADRIGVGVEIGVEIGVDVGDAEVDVMGSVLTMLGLTMLGLMA